MKKIFQFIHDLTPLKTALAALAGYALYVVLALSQHGWDPSFFIMAGDSYADPAAAAPNLTVNKNAPGYDGQFYYRFALNPFSGKVVDYGITLDLPLHRQQRILYPFLVWALSLGSPRAVPAVMVLVNLAAVFALAWLGASYAASVGRRPVWGVVFPLFAGVLLALTRDLVEILTACWLLAALVMARREKYPAAGALLALGVLTRETLLLAPFAFFVCDSIAALREGVRPRLKRLASWAFPGVVYVLWQVVLRLNWGFSTLLPNSSSVGIPFASVAGRFTGPHLTPVDQALFYLTLVATVLTIAAVAYTWKRSGAGPGEKTAWLMYFILVMSVDAYIWSQFWNYLRAYTEWYVLSSVMLLGAGGDSRPGLAVWGAWGVITLFVLQYLVV